MKTKQVVLPINHAHLSGLEQASWGGALIATFKTEVTKSQAETLRQSIGPVQLKVQCEAPLSNEERIAELEAEVARLKGQAL